MAVYPCPRTSRLTVAYSFFGTKLLTPRWFDDNDFAIYSDHPRLGKLLFWAFAYSRSLGIVRIRYWGRS